MGIVYTSKLNMTKKSCYAEMICTFSNNLTAIIRSLKIKM